MLILTRKPGERIFIDEDIIITVIWAASGQVKIGIDAPPNVSVHREEIYNKIKREGFISKVKRSEYQEEQTIEGNTNE